jgi:hypothetical protein
VFSSLLGCGDRQLTMSSATAAGEQPAESTDDAHPASDTRKHRRGGCWLERLVSPAICQSHDLFPSRWIVVAERVKIAKGQETKITQPLSQRPVVNSSVVANVPADAAPVLQTRFEDAAQPVITWSELWNPHAVPDTYSRTSIR